MSSLICTLNIKGPTKDDFTGGGLYTALCTVWMFDEDSGSVVPAEQNQLRPTTQVWLQFTIIMEEDETKLGRVQYKIALRLFCNIMRGNGCHVPRQVTSSSGYDSIYLGGTI